jgi:bacterioferritin
MKGSPEIIKMLNVLLADELTAINQYAVHEILAANWGYAELEKYINERRHDEMSHMERLIERIIFLGGQPITSALNPINVGVDVPKQFEYDHAAEAGAIQKYNDGIKLCVSSGDNATRAILDGILSDEDDHINDIEARQDQITQMGLQVFLGTQV